MTHLDYMVVVLVNKSKLLRTYLKHVLSINKWFISNKTKYIGNILEMTDHNFPVFVVFNKF